MTRDTSPRELLIVAAFSEAAAQAACSSRATSQTRCLGAIARPKRKRNTLYLSKCLRRQAVRALDAACRHNRRSAQAHADETRRFSQHRAVSQGCTDVKLANEQLQQRALAGVEAFGDVANDRAKHQRVLQGAVCPNTAATAAATQALQFRTAVGHAKPARVNKLQGVHKLEISKLVHIAAVFQHIGNKHREIEFEAVALA